MPDVILNKDQIRLLGLSDKEIVVLKALKRGPFLISQIVERSHLPRMTIYPILQSLVRRNLVFKTQNGKRWMYQLGDMYQLSNTDFSKNKNKFIRVNVSRDTSFSIYRGKSEILGLYTMMFGLHVSKRVFVLQSTKSADQMLRQVKGSAVNKVNSDIKRNKIIIDVIVSPSILNLSDLQSSVWKRSIEGRTTSVSLVSEEALDFSAEIWIFDDTVLITNWKEETCVVLKNTDVTAMIKTLFSSLKDSGKRFDSNEFLRGSLHRSKK